MTTALPPVMPQPAAPQSRDAAGALGVDAQRPQRTARTAETARAVRPVDAAASPTDPRLTTRRDRPVGPPPAFAINVLQHLRETAFDPPDVRDADAADEDAGEARAPARPASPAAQGDPARYALHPDPQDGTARRIDIKL
jgi:hypothetical protein